MKYMKNGLYIIAVLAVMGLVLGISTGIVMLGMEAIETGIGIALEEDLLYSISGSLGIAITGAVFAVYVKKKNYSNWMEVREPFRIKNCGYYCGIAWSLCSVLLYAVTAILLAGIFSMTNETLVAAPEGGTTFLLVNILFTVLIGPITEELLFRMGFYSLLRHRFGPKFSAFLCTLLFAAMHGAGIQGFCMCFAAGLVFLLIYTRTGNIWYSIAAHMACNLDATITNALEDMGVAFWGFPIQYEINGFNMVHPVLIIIAAVFLGVCIIKKRKSIPRGNAE